ncbi:hypothetical protein JNK62_01330 [bacterium]|nr:hypothetical protein [bacterium]
MSQKGEEIRQKGERIYRRLKPKLEPKLNGKVIIIDVTTGLYVLGDDIYEAGPAFKHLFGNKTKGYGRKIGPDPYTQRVGA